jgi:hypothetical protein
MLRLFPEIFFSPDGCTAPPFWRDSSIGELSEGGGPANKRCVNKWSMLTGMVSCVRFLANEFFAVF